MAVVDGTHDGRAVCEAAEALGDDGAGLDVEWEWDCGDDGGDLRFLVERSWGCGLVRSFLSCGFVGVEWGHGFGFWEWRSGGVG